MRLAVVTATIDLARAMDCLRSWVAHASGRLDVHILVQGAANDLQFDPSPLAMREGRVSVYAEPEILGVVPAFALGVQAALEDGVDIVACLHDDLEIEQDGWDQQVLAAFENPRVGLVGFGGALGLGDADIYCTPYSPMQLARQDFVSNMRHAEAHGRRASTVGSWQRALRAERVACLDGFSQIGRRAFWEGWYADRVGRHSSANPPEGWNLFALMALWGLVHHAYDACLGCFAARLGWDVWMLPIACHHFGGRTAVADDRYTTWARDKFTTRDWTDTKDVQGDAALWTEAHRITYEHFRDVLPIRV